LEEDDDGGSSWHVIQLENGLRCNHRLLHAKADTRSTNELVTDPFGMTSVDFEGCKKARTNGTDGGTGDHKRRVVTANGDEDTCKDGEDNNSQDQRKIHDSRLGSGDAFDGLEPDGNVEDEQHECRTNGECEHGREGNTTLLEDTGRNSGLLLAPELGNDEPN